MLSLRILVSFPFLQSSPPFLHVADSMLAEIPQAFLHSMLLLWAVVEIYNLPALGSALFQVQIRLFLNFNKYKIK